MQKFLISIGFFMLVQANSASASATVTGKSLYMHNLAQVTQELIAGDVELPIEQFLLRAITDAPISFLEQHIDMAIQRNYPELCSTLEVNEDGEIEGSGTDYGRCLVFAEQIQKTATQEADIRSLARELQLLAGIYEMNSDGYTGRISRAYTGLPAVVNIWESGSDAATSPVQKTRIRATTTPEYMESFIEDLQEHLEALVQTRENEDGSEENNYDRLAAAVFRYRHGFQTILDTEEECIEEELEEDNELAYLTARWCAVENALRQIVDRIPALNPPLSPQEVAMYQPNYLEDLGIIVWVRQDDAGLLWILPIEPVPLFIESGARGGIYADPPPIPQPSEGICSHPFGRRGYLCRPTFSDQCMEEGLVDTETTNDGSTITLTSCSPQYLASDQLSRWTESGPNVCGIGGWREPVEGSPATIGEEDTPAINEDIRPSRCSRCAVDLICEQPGGGVLQGIFNGGPIAQSQAKQPTGRIPVYINPSIGAFSTYAIIREYVHAQQKCNLPSGNTEGLEGTVLATTSEECCGVEFQANLVMCNALAEDGVLAELGYSTEMCGGILADGSCRRLLGTGCSGAVELPISGEDLERQLVEYVNEHARDIDVPESCASAVNELDSRSVAIRESLPRVCGPDCPAKYENTIGNNLCYLGQCIEQGIEEHRYLPGRITYGAQDEVFPWDACVSEDPQYAAFTISPPLPPFRPPQYRLERLIQELDTEFCQSNGQPRLTPPVLCSFSPVRRLSLKIAGYAETTQSLIAQDFEQIEHSRALQLQLGNIGARIGADLFLQYSERALQNLTEVITTAQTLLEQIGRTRFPTVMCPRFLPYNNAGVQAVLEKENATICELLRGEL